MSLISNFDSILVWTSPNLDLDISLGQSKIGLNPRMAYDICKASIITKREHQSTLDYRTRSESIVVKKVW